MKSFTAYEAAAENAKMKMKKQFSFLFLKTAPSFTRRTIAAGNTQNAPFAAKAPEISSFKRRRYACVIPQPGHGTPVRAFIGQGKRKTYIADKISAHIAKKSNFNLKSDSFFISA